MVARLAWAFDIKSKVDPQTGRNVELDIRYENVPNPKALGVDAVFEVREGRAEIIRVEEARERARDPLGVGKE